MLCDAGHDVVVFDNLERGHQETIDPRAKFLQGDLCHKEDIKSSLLAERPEAVIHFAAYIEVGESMKEPMHFFENNVSSSLNLMSSMVESGCKKLIFLLHLRHTRTHADGRKYAAVIGFYQILRNKIRVANPSNGSIPVSCYVQGLLKISEDEIVDPV